MYNAMRSQRGLSLVEVMLVLVVIGLLLGASIVPLGELTITDMYEQENKKLARTHEAISGYAITHRTQARKVAVGESPTQRVFDIPAGRPYLPCPDVNGDGHEDRVAYNAFGVGLTASVNTTLTVNATTNDLLRVGNCAVTRGILPWKTLGLPVADVWGNRYTYEVDDVFSNAVVGFGQDIIADSFDPRLTVTLSADNRLLYSRRDSHTLTTNMIERLMVSLIYKNSRRPIVVCDGDLAFVCRRETTTGVALKLVAGNIASVPLTSPRREYQPGDTVEGVPYVVLSHGKNGYGAVNHQANVGSFGFGGVRYSNGVICNAPLHSTSFGAVAMHLNAAVPGRQHEAANFPLIEETTPDNQRYCSAIVRFQNGHFVHQPRVNGYLANVSQNEAYDDIVEWKTRKELMQALTKAGIFPVEEFPVLRSY